MCTFFRNWTKNDTQQIKYYILIINNCHVYILFIYENKCETFYDGKSNSLCCSKFVYYVKNIGINLKNKSSLLFCLCKEKKLFNNISAFFLADLYSTKKMCHSIWLFYNKKWMFLFCYFLSIKSRFIWAK